MKQAKIVSRTGRSGSDKNLKNCFGFLRANKSDGKRLCVLKRLLLFKLDVRLNGLKTEKK